MNFGIPDHPAIRNAMDTGYEDGREPKEPRCPLCDQETDTVYKRDGEIVGCAECITSYDAWETPECFEEGSGYE